MQLGRQHTWLNQVLVVLQLHKKLGECARTLVCYAWQLGPAARPDAVDEMQASVVVNVQKHTM